MGREYMLLKERDLVSWGALLVGFKRGWITKSQIAGFAVSWLARATSEPMEAIALLAGCEKESEVQSLDRWRLGFLLTLDASSALTNEAKLSRLQELHSKLGCSEDMAACSRYYVEPGLTMGDIGKIPLEAMGNVISKLEIKLAQVSP